MKPFLAASAFALLAGCTVSSSDPVTTDKPLNTCPTTTTGPTFHEGEISGTETWRAAAGPHVVKANVNVRDGAKLIIEPCAVVKLARDADINVAFPLTPNSGELVAEGTADKPIKFERLDDGPWGRIFVHHPGKARLAHVTLDGGGGESAANGESLAFTGDGALPSKKGLSVDTVTVTKSRGVGIKLSGGGAFAAGSKALTINANGDDSNPYPLVVGELGVDSIPEGKYTGNKRDEILIDPETISGAGGFQESATMRNRGVPYRFGMSTLDDLHIGAGSAAASSPTLTIEAGVTLKMVRGSMIQLDGTNGTPAAIRALGTKEKPIVFTSSESTPHAGDWRGFYFNGFVSAENVLDNVRIEYTGADCSCSLVTCSEGVDQYEAALIFGDKPPTMFLKNSVIAHASGHAIVQGWDGAPHDWKASNSFEDVAGCIATLPRNADTSCPETPPSCR